MAENNEGINWSDVLIRANNVLEKQLGEFGGVNGDVYNETALNVLLTPARKLDTLETEFGIPRDEDEKKASEFIQAASFESEHGQLALIRWLEIMSGIYDEKDSYYLNICLTGDGGELTIPEMREWTEAIRRRDAFDVAHTHLGKVVWERGGSK